MLFCRSDGVKINSSSPSSSFFITPEHKSSKTSSNKLTENTEKNSRQLQKKKVCLCLFVCL